MALCRVCGRENPIEDANFCYYCGESFREGFQVNETDLLKERVSENEAQGSTVTAGAKPMSMWRWLALFALFLIPIYGWILLVVMMFLYAFGSKTTPERREMAKGFLLFLVVYVLFMMAGFRMLMEDPNFQAMMNASMGQ